MAYIIPSDMRELELSNAHPGELETLKLLRNSLPKDYTVFHSVRWTREYGSWTHFGEVDFVVLRENGRVLCIEQKNGYLKENSAGIYKTYDDGRKQFPLEQIIRSTEKIKEKWGRQGYRNGHLELDYLVYLPDYTVSQMNSVAGDESRIVDAGKDLVTRIQELMLDSTRDDLASLDTVFAFFKQSYHFVPSISQQQQAGQLQYQQLSGPVAEIFANLEMSPYRLRLTGVAGCGKSTVSALFAERAAKQNKRVLFACFNRSLALHVKNALPENSLAETFHGLCVAFLRSQGKNINFDKTEFWDKLPNMVLEESIPDSWLFDAIIVDEGQDFEEEWFGLLQLFAKDNADLLWLEDPDQNLYNKQPFEIEKIVRYRALLNYRTPQSIARFIHKVLPYEFEAANALQGLGVTIHTYQQSNDQIPLIDQAIQELVKTGFHHSEIAIVSCKGAKSSCLNDVEKIGNLKLKKYTGEYTDDGTPIVTDGQIHYETIYTFKGQQSLAVILVDVAPLADPNEQEQHLLYCAMTRATLQLVILAQEDKPFTQTLLNAAKKG